MCGIAGFIGAQAPSEQQREWVSAMTDRLIHRGPDEGGVWVEEPAALGHRRLSVIDLSTGSQPMLDANERAVIVYNGEVYNFPEIREHLEAKGYSFRTRSDTEVILCAYLDEGAACLSRFEGMFALALWDRRERTLFAARDRMGKKPFYYTLQNGLFAFASELNAFKELPPLRLEVDRQALRRYLAYEYVPTPGSIYRDVSKLRPGHYLIWKNGRVETAPYWDLPLPQERTDLSDDECCERIRFLAGRAVKRRLVSDVPLGVFLSGGIDSSAVVALMAAEGTANVKTFSIGFKEPSYDESPYARLVAERFGTDHHEEILSALEAADLLPEVVERFDEPMSDPSIVPTYLLSGLTRRDVTVALGGDGGDELFAGYEYYPGFQAARRYLRLPRALRQKLLEPLLRILPVSTGYVSPRHVAERFLNGTDAPEWLRAQTWLEAIGPELQAELWREPQPGGMEFEPEEIFSETRALWEGFPASEPINRVFYLFARQYLLDYILVKVDRCSMMHSLEVRAPFLDRDVVEFAFALPAGAKMRHGRRKYLLKKTFNSLLPRRVIQRPKRGFLIPTALWLKERLKPLVEELLGESHLRQQGLFRPETVRGWLEEHNAGRVDRRKEIWTLLVLQLWLQSHKPAIV